MLRNEANKIGKIRNEIQLLDLKAESILDLEIQKRLDLLKHKEDLEHIQRLDLLQKAKIKWAIEGDENTKFFDDEISKFAHQPASNTLFKTLSDQDVSLLDAPFTNEEIKEAIWNCGGGMSPGPNEFTFKLKKHYWEIIGSEFIEMVKRFEIEGFLPRGSNSSFIALVPKCEDLLHIKDFRHISLIGCQYKVIAKLLANRLLQVVSSVVSDIQTDYIKGRQIIDGPLMVNEIISWASKKKKRPFLLKVDFEKAFDSLDWGFLDNVMKQIGFSQKWRKWINGSMEALHVTLEDAKLKNIFEGVKVGSNNIDISYLQFADDALIMGKWSIDNAKNLCRILRC
ncbi:RNA-directed DNA polymerase, eukaryota, partial [Tanacetum coccineum]